MVFITWKETYEAATRGISPVVPPHPLEFTLSDPWDPFSLKPRSLVSSPCSSKTSKLNNRSENFVAAIADLELLQLSFLRMAIPHPIQSR
uniref:Uncharacterized protein n=1 Tax=Solanum lycopersicum TaxID=4081 RepID=A0A3Q7GUH4_SOLLC